MTSAPPAPGGGGGGSGAAIDAGGGGSGMAVDEGGGGSFDAGPGGGGTPPVSAPSGTPVSVGFGIGGMPGGGGGGAAIDAGGGGSGAATDPGGGGTATDDGGGGNGATPPRRVCFRMFTGGGVSAGPAGFPAFLASPSKTSRSLPPLLSAITTHSSRHAAPSAAASGTQGTAGHPNAREPYGRRPRRRCAIFHWKGGRSPDAMRALTRTLTNLTWVRDHGRPLVTSRCAIRQATGEACAIAGGRRAPPRPAKYRRHKRQFSSPPDGAPCSFLK